MLGRLQRLRRQEEMWRKRGFELFDQGMREEDAAIARLSSESTNVERQECREGRTHTEEGQRKSDL